MSGPVAAVALPGIPEVTEGDDLAELILGALERARRRASDDGVLVVSQKIVSKSEGRTVSLADVTPGAQASELGASLGKDPRLVELVLGESRRIVRAAGGVLITETKRGWVCANAGIDASNAPAGSVVLLPADPDRSAREIRAAIGARARARPGVIVADSFGRPWRLGQTEVAIGCAGVVALDDWRGRPDTEGRELAATAVATADELAAAADLARSKTSREPVVLVENAGRFTTAADGPGAAAALQRASAEDLFR